MPRVGKTNGKVEEKKEEPTTARALPFATLEEAPERLRVVYWGDPGSGKTSNALRATELGKVLVIDTERRLKRSALIRRGVDPAKVSIWPKPDDPEDITFANLSKLVRQIKRGFESDPDMFTTVVVDSVTELVGKLISDATDNRNKVKGVVDTFERFDQDFRDYNTAGKMFRKLLRQLRDLPCHLVFTAHQRRDEDQDTKKVTYGPAVSPVILVDLYGQMDTLLFTKKAEAGKPFRALARGTSRYAVKDDSDTLPEVLAEPSIDRVHAYLFGGLTEDNDEVQNTLKKKKENEDA